MAPQAFWLGESFIFLINVMENKEINFDYPVFKDPVFLYTDGEGDKMFTIFNKFFLNEFCKNFTTKIIDKIVLIN
jgi:hypothetical protein